MSPISRKFRSFKKQVYGKKSLTGTLLIFVMIIMASLTSVFLFFPEPVKAAHTDFSYKKLITINSSRVPESLINFPIWVYNVSDDFKDTDTGGFIQPDGDDIVFYSYDNATQYNHEIEVYDGTTGTIGIWVNVTYVDGGSDTELWVYYGDGDGANQEDVAGTWDDDYAAVWHMNGTTATDIYDSTGNGNDGTGDNGNPDYQQTGKCGYAVNFTASANEYIKLGSSTSFKDDTIGTIESWVYLNGTLDEDAVVFCGSKTVNNRVIAMVDIADGVDVDVPVIYMRDGGLISYCKWGSNVSAIREVWNYLGYTQNGSSDNTTFDNPQFWSNGSKPVQWWTGSHYSAPEIWFGNLTDEDFFIGWDNNSLNMNGLIDELRISSVLRNDSWITTSYNTTNSPSTFLLFGSEVSANASLLTLGGLEDNTKLTFVIDPGSYAWSNTTNPGGTMNATWSVATGDNVTEVRVNFSHPANAQNINNTNLSMAFSRDNATWGMTTIGYSGTNFTLNSTQWETYNGTGCYGDNPFDGTGMIGIGIYSIYMRVNLTCPADAVGGTYTQTSCSVWWKRVY